METIERYYQILGINPSSSLQEINQAYIRAINELRQRRSSTNPEVQTKAQAQAREINAAYEKIKKVYSPSKEAYGSVHIDDAPLSPQEHKPLPPATVNSTFDKAAAFKAAVEKAAAGRFSADKAAVEKAAADWFTAEKAAEEKALAEKAAAAVAAAHATAAAISAAVLATKDPEAMARVAAINAAADRDLAERAAAARAAAARAAAARAAEERAAAVARTVALLIKGLLLLSFCLLTVIVYAKAVKPVLTARKSAVVSIAARHNEKRASVSRRDVKLFQTISQSPANKIIEENNVEKTSVISTMPAIVTEPAPQRTPMDAAAVKQAAIHAAAVRKAAEQGDAKAQGRLGYLHETGNGVHQDYSEAAAWYRKGAEGGDAEAQKNLAILYAEGKGVSKDLREAVKWYRRAANQGNTEAQRALEIWTIQ